MHWANSLYPARQCCRWRIPSSIRASIARENCAGNGARKVPDAVITEGVTIGGFPIRFSALPELSELWMSDPGQDNPDVLKSTLGYTDAQVQELVEPGVIVARSS